MSKCCDFGVNFAYWYLLDVENVQIVSYNMALNVAVVKFPVIRYINLGENEISKTSST